MRWRMLIVPNEVAVGPAWQVSIDPLSEMESFSRAWSMDIIMLTDVAVEAWPMMVRYS